MRRKVTWEKLQETRVSHFFNNSSYFGDNCWYLWRQLSHLVACELVVSAKVFSICKILTSVNLCVSLLGQRHILLLKHFLLLPLSAGSRAGMLVATYGQTKSLCSRLLHKYKQIQENAKTNTRECRIIVQSPPQSTNTAQIQENAKANTSKWNVGIVDTNKIIALPPPQSTNKI